MEIKDSGERRQFNSGAVRDMAEGKGRFDLMPLGNISDYLISSATNNAACFFDYMTKYELTKDIEMIYNAIRLVTNFNYDGNDYEMLLDLAKHFEAGCKKYGDRNWQMGVPIHCYIDSACRHFTKYMAGWEDEPHAIACIWNLICLTWTVENIKEETSDGK